jgi:NAD(P)-dependent dehydrogenase (short-subunit alcohol dehydrogenase family)
MELGLTGKTALVTGASEGIGSAPLAGCEAFVTRAAERLGGVDIVNITGTTQQAVPLAPGRIQTARSDRLLDATAAAQGTSRDALLAKLVKTIPSGRVGTTDDVADAVCFVVSERATDVNGAALVIDGSKSLVI